MKKSILGMILLSAMVLFRALLLLVDEDESSKSFFLRSDSFQKVNAEFLALHQRDIKEINPTDALLLAARIELPKIRPATQPTDTRNYISEVSTDDALIAMNSTEEAIHSESDELGEDVIPMEYVSNTGYGLWNPGTSENNNNLHQELESNGNVPLDRNNTISESMSRLFPRTPY